MRKELKGRKKELIVEQALIDEIVVYEDSINIKHCITMGKNSHQKLKKCPLLEQHCEATAAVGRVG